MSTQNSQDQSKGLRLVIASIDFHPINTHVDYRKGVSGDSCTIKMEDISVDMHSDGCSLLMIDVPRAGLIHFNRDNGRIKLFPVGAEFLTATPPAVEDLSEGRMVDGIVTVAFEGKELDIVISRPNDSDSIIVETILHDDDVYHDEIARASVEFQIRW